MYIYPGGVHTHHGREAYTRLRTLSTMGEEASMRLRTLSTMGELAYYAPQDPLNHGYNRGL